MKKISLTFILAMIFLKNSYAGSFDYTDKILQSATSAVSITSNASSYPTARAVWIGTTQSDDFSFDCSTWVTFQGATAGTLLPFQVCGARITSGSAAPVAGDVVFLY